MFQPKWLQALHFLELEFWLPLPLLGLFFWIGGGVVCDLMLSRSYEMGGQIQANTRLQGERVKKVVSIKVEINRSQGLSKVKVKTATVALKELEFEFPVIEISKVEVAIGQELGLSPSQVRKLVRYQISAAPPKI